MTKVASQCESTLPVFDENAVHRLAALMRDMGLQELRVVRGQSSIHLVKDSAAAVPEDFPDVTAASSGTAPAVAAPGAAAHSVLAPLFGIVHLTPAPGQPPFVVPGCTVETGQVLLLVEAMKTFHEVTANRAGVVTSLHVTAGQEVKAGALLMELGAHV